MKGFSLIRNAAAIAVVAGAAGVVGAVSGAGTGASAVSADRAADIVAIQNTQACYGRAQDIVYRNYANKSRAEREGVAAFEQRQHRLPRPVRQRPICRHGLCPALSNLS